MDLKKVTLTVVSRLLMAILVLGLLFLGPAGIFDYWEAWAYLVVPFVPMTWMMVYFIRNDPELLERHMRMREKREEQGVLIGVMLVFFIPTFLLPGVW